MSKGRSVVSVDDIDVDSSSKQSVFSSSAETMMKLPTAPQSRSRTLDKKAEKKPAEDALEAELRKVEERRERTKQEHLNNLKRKKGYGLSDFDKLELQTKLQALYQQQNPNRKVKTNDQPPSDQKQSVAINKKS